MKIAKVKGNKTKHRFENGEEVFVLGETEIEMENVTLVGSYCWNGELIQVVLESNLEKVDNISDNEFDEVEYNNYKARRVGYTENGAEILTYIDKEGNRKLGVK